MNEQTTVTINDDSILVETADNAVVNALEGNDVITGNIGNDNLFGGSGDDSLDGDEGNDSLFGGAGNDSLFGGTGDNNDDLLVGGEGDDFLDGGNGNNTLIGGAGSDTLDNFFGTNLLIGGDGNDTILAGSLNDTLVGGAGNDSLSGDRGDDLIEGGAGNDTLIAGSFADGNDTLVGGADADTLTGADSRINTFAYSGNPFEGQDVSDPQRQVIGEEDSITNFELAVDSTQIEFEEDIYLFDASDYNLSGDVNFQAVDANLSDASIESGTNVVALLNSDDDNNPDTPFTAVEAADQIAELTGDDGAGLFVYYNSELQLNRLVYSANLNDNSADLKIIARQTDRTGQLVIDSLDNFSANNFEFGSEAENNLSEAVGNIEEIDTGNSQLNTTSAEDLIDLEVEIFDDSFIEVNFI